MYVRTAKTMLCLSVGLFLLLVGLDNVFDYGTNFAYVQHVLSMDTVPGDAAFRWRAITQPAAHHVAYGLIIATEIATGVLCLFGALKLLQARRAPADAFNTAKHVALVGLALGFALWFFGFMVVGGEWFQMWRSPTWNGQQAAFRFAACLGVVMLFLAQRDDELAGG